MKNTPPTEQTQIHKLPTPALTRNEWIAERTAKALERIADALTGTDNTDDNASLTLFNLLSESQEHLESISGSLGAIRSELTDHFNRHP